MKYIQLIESRENRLFHGTSLLNFVSIYIDRKILSSDSSRDELGKPAIRTTRDWTIARQFSFNFTGAVIEFDRAKIRQRYKISPFAYPHYKREHNRGEAEEVIFAKSISFEYIKNIYINKNKINKILVDEEKFHDFVDEFKYTFDYKMSEEKMKNILNDILNDSSIVDFRE